MKAEITLIPVGGLGNRIYAITSAIDYCLDNDLTLEIIWFKDKGLNCTFNNLFTLENIPTGQITIREASLIDLITTDRPRRRNLHVPRIFQKIVYDTCLRETHESQDKWNILEKYIKSSKKKRIHIAEFSNFYNAEDCGKYILLNDALEKKVQAEIAKFSNHKVVGIHIRRTDNELSIKYSPTSLFIHKMKTKLKKNENVFFYLASDSNEDKKTLIDHFGDRIITHNEDAERRTSEGIERAVVELFSLSRTSKIIGSFNSTFSQVAAKLNNIPYEELSNKN